MIFSTYLFLFWFLPVTLLVYHLVPVRFRNAWVAFASYVFYGWWRPEYCVLLFGMTAFNYYCGERIVRTDDPTRKKRWVTLSVVGSLSLLGYFKYAGMFSIWVQTVVGWTGASASIPTLDILLPIGISFYTFQALSYTIDLYRGDAKKADGLVSFAAYIAMFPQLIAGPIVRYQWIADELRERTHSWSRSFLGARFLILGLGKKLILADTFALAVPAAFENPDPNFAEAWIGVLGYTLQIYFDFSAYSDMAVGLGLFMGFRFPRNFDSPYKSKSITEFWQRWHISLSSWLRDYLYIPLGGNRLGSIRTYINLMLVMLLGGLWHGASIQFVLWGAWHGGLLALERGLGKAHPLRRVPAPVAMLITNFLVILSWVPFRATSIDSMKTVFASMFDFGSGVSLALFQGVELFGADYASAFLTWILIGIPAGFLATWLLPNSWEYLRRRRPAQIAFEIVVLAWSLAVVLSYQSSPFLYFQF